MYQQLRVKLRRLLDPDELELLDNLTDAVPDSSRPDGDRTSLDTGQITERTMIMAEDFLDIINEYEEEKLSIELFIETFPKWKKNRKECIKKLSKIAKSLDRDRHRFNIAKIFGYCLSISGGAMVIAAGAALNTNADVSTLAVAGGTAAVAGSLAVLGLSISESAMLRRRVRKAKKLLKEDSKQIQSIRDRLNRVKELQEALQSVLDTNINKEITDNLKKFVKAAVKIKNDHKKLKFIEDHAKSVIRTMCAEQSEIPVAVIITLVRVAVTTVFLLSKTENRFVFDFVSLCSKSVVVVASLVEHSVGVFGVASSLGSASAPAATIAVGTVGMVLDAVGFVKTSVDILRDSRSPEAKKITEATEHLFDEAARLDRLYQLLTKPP